MPINKNKLSEEIIGLISNETGSAIIDWDNILHNKIENLLNKAILEAKNKLLEEVRNLPKYQTTNRATYENGYNEGHNNAIIDIIQMLERQELSQSKE